MTSHIETNVRVCCDHLVAKHYNMTMHIHTSSCTLYTGQHIEYECLWAMHHFTKCSLTEKSLIIGRALLAGNV